MCNCLLSYLDFFIPLLGVYYSFSDLSYTHTQQLSFANSDYLIIVIHLVIKEIDIHPDNDSNNRGHGGFRPGAGRKRRKATTSIKIMTNERKEILYWKSL